MKQDLSTSRRMRHCPTRERALRAVRSEVSRRNGRAHHSVAAVPIVRAAASVASGDCRRDNRMRRLWSWFAATTPQPIARKIPGTSILVSSRGIKPSKVNQPNPIAKKRMNRSERRRGRGARTRQMTASPTAIGPTITPARRSESTSTNPKTPIRTGVGIDAGRDVARRSIGRVRLLPRRHCRRRNVGTRLSSHGTPLAIRCFCNSAIVAPQR